MQIADAGDRALLVTLTGVSSAQLRAAAKALRNVSGVVAAIVGHQSVYVIGTTDRSAVTQAVENAHPESDAAPKQHRIEVSFGDADALDMADFLAKMRISREEFLRRVADLRRSVRYLGLRARFAY